MAKNPYRDEGLEVLNSLGHLVRTRDQDVCEISAALRAADASGYARGLEDAAKVADGYADEQDKSVRATLIAKAIRALKPTVAQGETQDER